MRPFRWFADGRLNVVESCVDRHAAASPERAALIWEADEPGEGRQVSYGELHELVCRAANVLRSLGVQRGDRVIIYMGMVPEAAVAMLACARVGAVPHVVFGGFSADALRDRIEDCGARLVITQDEGARGGKSIPLKAVVDEALSGTTQVGLVVQRTGQAPSWDDARDLWWHEAGEAASTHDAEVMEAEDPLFILYIRVPPGPPRARPHLPSI